MMPRTRYSIVETRAVMHTSHGLLVETTAGERGWIEDDSVHAHRHGEVRVKGKKVNQPAWPCRRVATSRRHGERSERGQVRVMWSSSAKPVPPAKDGAPLARRITLKPARRVSEVLTVAPNCPHAAVGG
jgi:hypothetical protein